MNTTKYHVKCLVCQGKSAIEIDDLDRIYWSDVDKVISGRKRLDQQWGWQCRCGNDDIMTEQERQFITNPQTPSPSDIKRVVDDLIIQEPKFSLETV